MVSYAPLWNTMEQKGITTYALIKKHNINKIYGSNTDSGHSNRIYLHYNQGSKKIYPIQE